MKRKSKYIKSYLLIVTVLFTTACGDNKINNNSDNTTTSEGLPTFIVMSDTHFGNTIGQGPMEKVPRAIKNLVGNAPDADALFVVGDITNNGEEWQYDQLLTVFGDPSIVPENLPVYFMMGNHDHYAGSNATNTFLNKIKQPLHQYVVIKEYPFITISESGSDQNDFDGEALRFLTEHLEKASKAFPGKPVFVFIHVPNVNTSYGSWKTGTLEDGGWATDVFKSTLDQYPQAVVFSGHTHYPIGDPRSIYQDKFTAVNTASTTYSEVEPQINLNTGTFPDQYQNVTEGLIVKVLDNQNIELQRWDTYRNQEIFPKWILKAPHDGSQFTYKNRNGGTPPTFQADDKPNVQYLTDNSCNVAFKQATDDEVVQYYIVAILDQNDNNVKQVNVFSGFFLNTDMPDSINVTVDGLDKNTTYTAKVTAVDSYRQLSKPINTNFTINSLNH